MIAFCSLQAECHSFDELCGRGRPEEGSHKVDEVPLETTYTSGGQREGLHQRYSHIRDCITQSHFALLFCRSLYRELLPVRLLLVMTIMLGLSAESVFGCHLATLCALEKSNVPSFVEKCINAVERRGNPF